MVSDAIFGLSSSQTGADHIDAMGKLATTQKPDSLIWRAVALNQKEGAEALDTALAYAQSHTGITLAEEDPYSGFAQADYRSAVRAGNVMFHARRQGRRRIARDLDGQVFEGLSDAEVATVLVYTPNFKN